MYTKLLWKQVDSYVLFVELTVTHFGKLLLCQPKVTVTSRFVYIVIRYLESIDHLCINPIRRIELIHKWSIDSRYLKWCVQVNVYLTIVSKYYVAVTLGWHDSSTIVLLSCPYMTHLSLIIRFIYITYSTSEKCSHEISGAQHFILCVCDLCMREAKTLSRLRVCPGSIEPFLITIAVRIKLSKAFQNCPKGLKFKYYRYAMWNIASHNSKLICW